jgi:hypothetical protein
MTNPIRLEDDWEVSWDDAKTRLKVAAEVYGFPFYITLDEVAYAYKDMEHYLADGEYPEDEREIVATWWKDHAHEITSYEHGLRVIYPWFHEGEEMPTRIKLEGKIGGFQ